MMLPMLASIMAKLEKAMVDRRLEDRADLTESADERNGRQTPEPSTKIGEAQ